AYLCSRSYPARSPPGSRVVPIELRTLPAADIDISRTRDAVLAADRPLAVPADEGARLVIDLRFCVHLLIWDDDDPPDHPGMCPEHLHISANREASGTGVWQHDPKVRHRSEPIAQHTRLQDGAEKRRHRDHHQQAD